MSIEMIDSRIYGIGIMSLVIHLILRSEDESSAFSKTNTKPILYLVR